MWDYLFFIYHLDQKDATDFSYIEQYVAQKLLEEDFDFFPVSTRGARPKIPLSYPQPTSDITLAYD